MKLFAACLLSAVAGGLFAVWIVDGGPAGRAAAQERRAAGPGPQLVPESRLPAPPEGGPQRGGRGAADSRAAQPPPEPQPADVAEDAPLSPEEAVNIAVYEHNNRSVVNITSRGSRSDGFFLLEIPMEGSGSGTIIDRSGHVLTNYHVIEGAQQVAVTLFDGNTYDASLVGADPIYDLAVLKIDAPRSSLSPASFGDSSQLKVGMRVFAIGNPFGLERTMTTGIVSSLNRSLQVRGNRTIKSIIQIDAAVNPGNSGGPLLDSHGRLIGMNTAIASRTGQNSGVGFAIPVNLVTRVVPQLIKHGRVIRPEIGILKVYETDEGLLISQLAPGGPAERSGLRGPRIVRTRRGVFSVERVDRTAADLIVAVNGQAVGNTDDFLSSIEVLKPGDTVQITIVREGRRVDVPVVLGGDEP
ncbi:MAG TPA: trypsin-like peptidase domain-containing protein [Planctomycetaceae bacterium]|nr:trypsin-like peptidase domain-containing protein [Planctomycetaceae bacterium]